MRGEDMKSMMKFCITVLLLLLAVAALAALTLAVTSREAYRHLPGGADMPAGQGASLPSIRAD